MRRIALWAAIAALAAIVAVGQLDAAAPSNLPTTAVFTDAGMTILSDGFDPDENGVVEYTEGADCVRSWYNSQRGNYYFRTASGTHCEYVNGEPVGETQRSVTLDLTQRVLDCDAVDDGYGNELLPCGVNVFPDARLIADSLFKSGASTTPVTIHFDLYPNFVNPTAFMLTFIDPVGVIDHGDGSRTLGGTNLLAELQVRQVKGRKSTFVTVGQYTMAFQMTVTPE